MAPAAALLLVVAGFLWLALWRERWRLRRASCRSLAAMPLALAAPRPDILVDAAANAVAVRGADGRLQIVGGKGASFEVENWLRADADPRDADDASDLATASPAIRSAASRSLGRRRRGRRWSSAATPSPRIAGSPRWSSRRFDARRRLRRERRLVIDRDRARRASAPTRSTADRGPDASKAAFRIETAYPGGPPAVHAAGGATAAGEAVSSGG